VDTGFRELSPREKWEREEQANEFNLKTLTVTLATKAPSKWRLVDLKSGDEYELVPDENGKCELVKSRRY
jgi:hypothetical protein